MCVLPLHCWMAMPAAKEQKTQAHKNLGPRQHPCGFSRQSRTSPLGSPLCIPMTMCPGHFTVDQALQYLLCTGKKWHRCEVFFLTVEHYRLKLLHISDQTLFDLPDKFKQVFFAAVFNVLCNVYGKLFIIQLHLELKVIVNCQERGRWLLSMVTSKSIISDHWVMSTKLIFATLCSTFR